MTKSVAVVLLAVIGAIVGYVYFQDGTNTAKPRIFSVTQPKEVPRSMKAAPTNDTAPVRHPVSQPPEITDKVQDKTVENPGSFTVRPPAPESLKKTAPIKSEPLDAVPLPRFAGESRTPFASEKTGAPVVLAPGSGSKETVKAATPTEGKTSGAVSPDRSKKPLVAALVPDKTSGNVSTPASTPAKPPAQTAAVKEEPMVVHQMVTQEKERSAATMPEKKSVPVQEDAGAVYLKRPAAEPETVAQRTVSQYNLQDRLKTFLRAYCRTYEKKNLDMFGAFFAPDAVEQGKPFKSWASQYRQNFNKIDSMLYNIDLERYATRDETGEVRIEGIFHVRAKLSGSGKWRKNSGRITMVLEPDKDSFRVKELIY